MRGLESNQMAIEPANLGESQAFERLAEPFRRDIKLHCYRMLGSLHEHHPHREAVDGRRKAQRY